MGRTVTELMSANISNAITNAKTWGGVLIIANSYGADPTGATDSTVAIQKAADATPAFGTLLIPSGKFKITDRIAIHKPINIECDGVIYAYQNAGFDFGIDGSETFEAPGDTPANFKICGLKIVYKDTLVSTDRIGISLRSVAYNGSLENCTVTGHEIIDGVEQIYGKHYASVLIDRCFQIRIVDCFFQRAIYGVLIDSSDGDNWGNYLFENNSFFSCNFGVGNRSSSGLRDSITFVNNSFNHFFMGDPYNYGYIITGVTASATKGDMSVTVTDGSLFSGIATPFPIIFSNGSSAIVESISTNTLNLQYPLTISVGTSEKAIAGNASIITNSQWRMYNLIGNHFEEATYGVFVGGWGSAGVIQSNLFNKHVNPIYLYQSENTVILPNTYEKRTGDYYFVRLGDSTFFREIIIYAPVKGYFDPADNADGSFIYVKDNPANTFTPMTVYNQVFSNLKVGSARFPAFFNGNSTKLQLDLSAMSSKVFELFKNAMSGWSIDLDNNQEVSSIRQRFITESGTTRRVIVERGFTAAPTTGTWRRGDIVYNDTPSAGGYVGWSCVTAGTPGTWKGFGLIEA